jgi:hypothetical protein
MPVDEQVEAQKADEGRDFAVDQAGLGVDELESIKAEKSIGYTTFVISCN